MVHMVFVTNHIGYPFGLGVHR